MEGWYIRDYMGTAHPSLCWILVTSRRLEKHRFNVKLNRRRHDAPCARPQYSAGTGRDLTSLESYSAFPKPARELNDDFKMTLKLASS